MGYTVAMAIYSVVKAIKFLPVNGQFFDAVIIMSTDKEWL